MTSPTPNRNPIAEQLGKAGPAIASLVTLVTGLGTMLGWSTSQTAALEEYGGQVVAATAPTGPIAIAVGAVVGLISGGSALLGILKAGKGAEAQSTPVTSPRDAAGAVLVRADGLPLGSPVGSIDPATSAIPASSSSGWAGDAAAEPRRDY